ncbi:MAG: hypothetical protein K9L74_07075 [Candidatus Izimaplasma sp.]|nr:hypothetical protein [Candidatus Izimaplasma bacterium]
MANNNEETKLKECVNCGKQVDFEVEICPHCGMYLRDERLHDKGGITWSIAAAILALGVIILAKVVAYWFMIGLVVPIVVYVIIKGKHPLSARWFGFGVFIPVVGYILYELINFIVTITTDPTYDIVVNLIS